MKTVSSVMIIFGVICVSCSSIPQATQAPISDTPELTLSPGAVSESQAGDPLVQFFSLDNVDAIPRKMFK